MFIIYSFSYISRVNLVDDRHRAADTHHRRLWAGWKRAPSVATFPRIMATVDASILDAVLTEWIRTRSTHKTRHRAGQPPLEALAIDGKEVCGAKHGGGTKTFLMAALDHGYGTVVGQELWMLKPTKFLICRTC